MENLKSLNRPYLYFLKKNCLDLSHCTSTTLVLIHFPLGSGNTWTRYLLQFATGIQTGSVYNDTTLKLNGYPGEGVNNGSVLVIKHHRLTR